MQQPLSLGSDVVLHSVTKYLSGHSDVVLGALVTSDAGLRAALLHHRTIHGGIAGPFEAWLALRGLRTLALRIERSQASAQILAERLDGHPKGRRRPLPRAGLGPRPRAGQGADEGFRFRPVHRGGTGGWAGQGLSGADAADRMIRALQLWLPATSLGGVESLIERRRRHAAEPESVPDNLVRMSVGIENVEDLWADLEQALGTLDG